MLNEDYNLLPYIVIAITTIVLLLGILMKKPGGKRTDEKNIHESLNLAGYAYDSKQDIFISTMDAWQKKFGYSRIFDEAAAPLNMIIDCEPIRFNFGGKKWLIEFWKGQYGMTTGCEVGIYTAEDSPTNTFIPTEGIFYNCAEDDDQLYMSLVLRKNERVLFRREGRHWWLTGFIPGEFSEPHELHMEISINFPDKTMCYEFIKSLELVGYSTHNIRVIYTTVWISFRNPFSPQPLTRTPVTDSIVQRKNQYLCARYSELTAGKGNSLDKIIYLWREFPDLYESVLRMGKPLQLFKRYGGRDA